MTGIRSLLDLLDTTDEVWQDRALCKEVDADIFYPEKGVSTAEAKRTCAACEVQAECLEYALDNSIQWGVWGGKSALERLKMTRLEPAAPVVKVSRVERDAEIISLTASGASDEWIAEQVGVSTRTVLRARKRLAGAA